MVGGGGRGVREAGCRSGGGCSGGASGSEESVGVCFAGLMLDIGPSSSSGSSKVTFFADVLDSGDASSWTGCISPLESFRPSSMFAFFSSLSMSDELSPPVSSFLASSISSSDICASRCLFSWSIEGPSISCLFTIDRGERCGDTIVWSTCLFGWLASWTWFSLLCLNFEGPVLVLCAGKPVSELLNLGGAGGLASDVAFRSLISPTRPTLKLGICAGTEESIPSGSSSESKLISKRSPRTAIANLI